MGLKSPLAREPGKKEAINLISIVFWQRIRQRQSESWRRSSLNHLLNNMPKQVVAEMEELALRFEKDMLITAPPPPDDKEMESLGYVSSDGEADPKRPGLVLGWIKMTEGKCKGESLKSIYKTKDSYVKWVKEHIGEDSRYPMKRLYLYIYQREKSKREFLLKKSMETQGRAREQASSSRRSTVTSKANAEAGRAGTSGGGGEKRRMEKEPEDESERMEFEMEGQTMAEKAAEKEAAEKKKIQAVMEEYLKDNLTETQMQDMIQKIKKGSKA
jgi:hypothetical protein